MTEPPPNPRVSNKISPLAVIVVIILIGIVIVAFVGRHGHHETPSGVAVPMAAPANAVMPRLAHDPDNSLGPVPPDIRSSSQTQGEGSNSQ